VRITRNTLAAVGRAQAFGVRVDGALSVKILDNDLRGPGLAAAGYAGVYLRATNPAEDFRSAIVRRNAISNWGDYGVSVQGNGAARLLAVNVVDNVFDDTTGTMTCAMSLDDGTGAARAVTLSGNAMHGGVTTAVVRYPVGAVIVDADQPGAGVSVPPEVTRTLALGAVASSRGDRTVWRDPAGPGAVDRAAP
jgi:hypothetical protein